MQLSSEEFLLQKIIRLLNLVTAGKKDVDLFSYSPKNKTYVVERHKQNGSYLSTCFRVCLSDTCSEVLKQLTTTLHRLGHSECNDIGLGLATVLAKAQVEVSTDLMPQIATGEGNVSLRMGNVNMTTTNVHSINIVNIAGGIMLTNMLPIVQVIDKNILRWFGNVRRREEEFTLRVVMQLRMKGNIPKGDQY